MLTTNESNANSPNGTDTKDSYRTNRSHLLKKNTNIRFLLRKELRDRT